MADDVNIEGMDDKAFDALKSDMISGKDVTQKPAPEVVDPTEYEDEPDIDPPDGAETERQPGQKQDSVPFGRYEHKRNQLREEREARARDKAEFERRDAERQKRLEDLFAQFAPKPQAQEPEPVPDVTTDPLGRIQHQDKTLEQLQKRLDARDEADKRSNTEREIANVVTQSFQQAAARDPELTPAYQAVFNSFAQEQMALYGLNEKTLADPGNAQALAQIKANLARMEQDYMVYAVQNKIDIPTMVKGLAAARGWKPAPKQSETPAGTQGRDLVAEAERNQAQKDDIRRAATSLTPTGGSVARTGMPSPQELLDMTNKQYDDFRSKHSLGEAFSV